MNDDFEEIDLTFIHEQRARWEGHLVDFRETFNSQKSQRDLLVAHGIYDELEAISARLKVLGQELYLSTDRKSVSEEQQDGNPRVRLPFNLVNQARKKWRHGERFYLSDESILEETMDP